MNTSNGDKGAPAASGNVNWPSEWKQAESLAGLPDPAQLARMASEFFTALPGVEPAIPSGSWGQWLPRSPFSTTLPTYSQKPVSEGQIGSPIPGQVQPDARSSSSAAAAVPPMPAPVPQSAGGAAPLAGPAPDPAPDLASVPAFGFLQDARPLFAEAPVENQSTIETPASGPTSLPGEAGFGAVPWSLDDEILKGQLAEIPQPPSPTIPGALGAVDSSAYPTFSFMEEARPLFSSPPSMPGPVPASEPPSEADVGAFAQKITPQEMDWAPDRWAPQAPGTVTHTPDLRAPATYGFLDQLRPLASVDTVPVLEPMAAEAPQIPGVSLSSQSFDAAALRRDFPILEERVNGRPLVWLDNAATTQKPQSVIERLNFFYRHENSNVHRAAHELAARATDAYESAREKIRRFLNASAVREIIFVRGTTEGINLVAQSWGRRYVQKDDEIVITWLEHHANIVPWQMLCSEKGARLRVAPVDDSGQVILEEYEKLLGPKTRLVSVAQVSNALGTITPVKAMIDSAHRHGAKVLVDGAQAVSHMPVDVQALNCDFYVLSGHKMFAPTGIGVVFGKSEVLDTTPPWQGGGSMIQDVTFEKTVYHMPPQRFEAGTGSIADAVGLGAAVDYLERVGMANVSRSEHELLIYATDLLERIPGLRIIGRAKEKAGVLSFVLDGFRTEEVGDFLNRRGIAVRAGHHCAQPIHRRFGLESTIRVSFALYNTCEDVDALVAALWDLRQGRNPGLV
ncbi:MAG TPA: family 2A encapsulin nanocompartment cargo protein cysteine desulfurase [Terriglobales bacterium]|nr:family 2A encapsulin nanocompartment cargo protein cysteine desulfurase [Terriglobales bacterium]